jgi:hypothetical protein
VLAAVVTLCSCVEKRCVSFVSYVCTQGAEVKGRPGITPYMGKTGTGLREAALHAAEARAAAAREASEATIS